METFVCINQATESSKKLICSREGIFEAVAAKFLINPNNWILQYWDKALEEYCDLDDVKEINSQKLRLIPRKCFESTLMEK